MQFYLTRYKNRISKEYSVEIITPLFLAGANTKDKPELRTQSIKGMLRFWWRAGSDIKDITTLQNKENQIFGSTKQKSAFQLKVSTDSNLKTDRELSGGWSFEVKRKDWSIFDYLAYGICTYNKAISKKEYIREHFVPEQTFTLHITYRDQKIQQEIEKALQLFSQFGGLGAKSRNGFGNIKIHKQSQTPKMPTCKNDLLPYTAFSRHSKLFLFNIHSSWQDALSEIGLAYREARLSIEPKHKFDLRPLIAKPLISYSDKLKINDRHAKPYFLHVNKLDNGKYQGQILFLPYQYYRDKEVKNYKKACEKLNNTLAQKAKNVIKP